MKIERKLIIGKNEYTVTVEADKAIDFFKQMSFFDSLPQTGPNGETDLVLSYRTPKNYEYYSIVSQQAKMEFKFGQHKDRPGSLFAKGWEPLYQEDGAEANEETQNQAHTGIGLGATSVPAPAPAITQPKAPAVGLGSSAPKATAPKANAAAPAAAPSNAPAQVQNQAAAILSKFGI